MEIKSGKMSEKQDTLRISANYNGTTYTVKFIGEKAENINDLLLDEIKNKGKKDEITF